MNENEVTRSNLSKLQGDNTKLYYIFLSACCGYQLTKTEKTLLWLYGLVTTSGEIYNDVREFVQEGNR